MLQLRKGISHPLFRAAVAFVEFQSHADRARGVGVSLPAVCPQLTYLLRKKSPSFLTHPFVFMDHCAEHFPRVQFIPCCASSFRIGFIDALSLWRQLMPTFLSQNVLEKSQLSVPCPNYWTVKGNIFGVAKKSLILSRHPIKTQLFLTRKKKKPHGPL